VKTIEQKTTTLKKTVIAARVLHNICIGVTYMTQTTATQMIALTITAKEELKPATISEILLKDHVWENL